MTIAAGLLLPAALLSAEPIIPDPQEKAHIMAEIRGALSSFDELQDARKKEASLRENPAIARDPKLRGDWAKAHERTQKAAKLWQDHSSRAIEFSERYYNLEPPTGSRRIAGGALEGMPGQWMPQVAADDDRFLRSRPDESGRPRHFGFKPEAQTLGKTGEDGQVIIRLYALQYSADVDDPGPLAMALHHEQVHFRELVAKGWKSLEHTEDAAWAASEDFAEKFLRPADPAVRDWMLKEVKKRREQAQRDLRFGQLSLGIGLHSAYVSAAEERKNKEEFERLHKERLAILERQKQLEEQVKRDRRERKAYEDIMRQIREPAPVPPQPPSAAPPPAPPMSAPALDVAMTSAWQAHRMLAALCRNPDAPGPFGEELRLLNRYRRVNSRFKHHLRTAQASADIRPCLDRLVDALPDAPGPEEPLGLSFFRNIVRGATTGGPGPSGGGDPRPVTPPDRPRCKYQGDWCK